MHEIEEVKLAGYRSTDINLLYAIAQNRLHSVLAMAKNRVKMFDLAIFKAGHIENALNPFEVGEYNCLLDFMDRHNPVSVTDLDLPNKKTGFVLELEG